MASTLFEQGYRRVLITGSSSGIGLALAKELIAADIEVIGVSRSPDKILSKQYTHLEVDLLDEADLETLLHFTQKNPPDIWINNAGQGLIGDVCSHNRDVIEANRQLLYDIPVLLSRHFKEIVKTMGNPCLRQYLVQVSSLAVELPIPNMPYYNAAKSALSAFSQSMLLDQKLPFSLIDFRPGDFDTGFMMSDSILNSSTANSPIHEKLIAQHRKAPKPEIAAKGLLKAIRFQRTGIVRCGNIFQSKIAPFGIRLLPVRLMHFLIRKYYKYI